MSYEIGTHITFKTSPAESIRTYLREVGEHIIFVVDRSSDATTTTVTAY